MCFIICMLQEYDKKLDIHNIYVNMRVHTHTHMYSRLLKNVCKWTTVKLT